MEGIGARDQSITIKSLKVEGEYQADLGRSASKSATARVEGSGMGKGWSSK